MDQTPPVSARPMDPDATAPLTEHQYLLLREHAAARRPIRSAATTARVSGVTILAIGLFGVPFAISGLVYYGSLYGLLVVAAICTVGMVELKGAARFRRADPGAATLLGCNQLAFLALIIVYCATRMILFSPDEWQSVLQSSQLSSGTAGDARVAQATNDLLGDAEARIGPLLSLAVYGFYSLVILLSVIFQGGLAIYYFTRRRHLHAAQHATPAWIKRVFAETGA